MALKMLLIFKTNLPFVSSLVETRKDGAERVSTTLDTNGE